MFFFIFAHFHIYIYEFEITIKSVIYQVQINHGHATEVKNLG